MSRLPSVGELVDDVFQVEEELDHGNFGAVYRVTDLLEHRTLALKVLKPGPHDEEELHRRFEREARLIYQLRHPHVVEVYYYGDTDKDLPYMAMEYLQGTDLKTLLRHHGGLAQPLARRITIESLAALHTAHSHDIIHRDLKPANIFLVNDGAKGHVKVLDFGFAKALEGEQNDELTNAGTLVGTPAYMSPELVHKKNVGPAADVYAMGLILAEMLAGEKIVQIESIYDTVLFQGSDKRVRLPEALEGSLFEPVIRKAIHKDLDQRFPTAHAMIEALRTLDLPGAGPYSREVPLNTAPPEIGNADPSAQTKPQFKGRPSLDEVEAQLRAGEFPEVDATDDDPTVERNYSFSNASEEAHGVNETPEAQPHRTRQPTQQVDPIDDAPPPAASSSSNSAINDILMGLLIGGLVLGGLLLWMNFG